MINSNLLKDYLKYEKGIDNAEIIEFQRTNRLNTRYKITYNHKINDINHINDFVTVGFLELLDFMYKCANKTHML